MGTLEQMLKEQDLKRNLERLRPVKNPPPPTGDDYLLSLTIHLGNLVNKFTQVDEKMKKLESRSQQFKESLRALDRGLEKTDREIDQQAVNNERLLRKLEKDNKLFAKIKRK